MLQYKQSLSHQQTKVIEMAGVPLWSIAWIVFFAFLETNSIYAIVCLHLCVCLLSLLFRWFCWRLSSLNFCPYLVFLSCLAFKQNQSIDVFFLADRYFLFSCLSQCLFSSKLDYYHPLRCCVGAVFLQSSFWPHFLDSARLCLKKAFVGRP